MPSGARVHPTGAFDNCCSDHGEQVVCNELGQLAVVDYRMRHRSSRSGARLEVGAQLKSLHCHG